MDTNYSLRITDAPGQPSRLYDAPCYLDDAIAECRRLASVGHVGGTVEVIDKREEHPDHNVVHSETRRG